MEVKTDQTTLAKLFFGMIRSKYVQCFCAPINGDGILLSVIVVSSLLYVLYLYLPSLILLLKNFGIIVRNSNYSIFFLNSGV